VATGAFRAVEAAGGQEKSWFWRGAGRQLRVSLKERMAPTPHLLPRATPSAYSHRARRRLYPTSATAPAADSTPSLLPAHSRHRGTANASREVHQRAVWRHFAVCAEERAALLCENPPATSGIL